MADFNVVNVQFRKKRFKEEFLTFHFIMTRVWMLYSGSYRYYYGYGLSNKNTLIDGDAIKYCHTL